MLKLILVLNEASWGLCIKFWGASAFTVNEMEAHFHHKSEKHAFFIRHIIT